MRDTPFTDPRMRFLAGAMGMRVFLVSLGVLFAATLVSFVAMRLHLERKSVWPIDLPPLPNLLWLSTATLVASSATMQWAVIGVRGGSDRRLQAGLILTLLLGLAFLLIQTGCWLTWLRVVSQRWSESSEYRFALTSFYILTGIHSLHVIGGLIPMIVVTRRALRGWYWPDYRTGVELTATYWHFLGAMWLVILITLFLAQ